jgi:hypothetical protein
MDSWLGLVIAGILLAIAGIAFIQYYLERQRTEQMRGIAGRRGWTFAPEAGPELLAGLGSFHLFSQGRSRKIRNLMHTQIRDIAVHLFDFRYTTSSGRHNRIHQQTVVSFESERLRLPYFELRPEHLFHKLAGSFGYQDIDFDSHPAFSDAYLLRGEDEAEVRALFSDEILGYYTRHRVLCTEGGGSQLVYYRAEKRVEPELVDRLVQEGLDVLDLFLEAEGPLGSLELLGVGLEQAEQSWS